MLFVFLLVFYFFCEISREVPFYPFSGSSFLRNCACLSEGRGRSISLSICEESGGGSSGGFGNRVDGQAVGWGGS